MVDILECQKPWNTVPLCFISRTGPIGNVSQGKDDEKLNEDNIMLMHRLCQNPSIFFEAEWRSHKEPTFFLLFVSFSVLGCFCIDFVFPKDFLG